MDYNKRRSAASMSGKLKLQGLSFETVNVVKKKKKEEPTSQQKSNRIFYLLES